MLFARGNARLRAAIRLHPSEPAVTFTAVPQTWGPGAVSDLIFPGVVGPAGSGRCNWSSPSGGRAYYRQLRR